MTAQVTAGPSGPAPMRSVHPPVEIPVLRLTPRTEPAERVPLFYLPGEPGEDGQPGQEREFTIPARPGANIALQYLHVAATRSQEAAYDYLLSKMLGEEGYRALREFDDLTETHLGVLIQVVTKVAMGALEAPKGQPASA